MCIYSYTDRGAIVSIEIDSLREPCSGHRSYQGTMRVASPSSYPLRRRLAFHRPNWLGEYTNWFSPFCWFESQKWVGKKHAGGLTPMLGAFYLGLPAF